MSTERRSILVVSSDEDFAERVTSALFSRCSIVRGLPQLETLRGLIESTGIEAIIVDLDDVAWDGRNITELIVSLKPSIRPCPWSSPVTISAPIRFGSPCGPVRMT